MKIAIVGAGGAGLTAAWLLEEQHDVTVYEQSERLGGHAQTITCEVAGKLVAVDAGFEFISDAMFPMLMRLLELLEVPLRPYPMLVTMFNTRNGRGYLMPPFHGWHLFPEGFAPRKLADLLRFVGILRAAGPLMVSRDTNVTVGQFLDRLGVPEDFCQRFMYPYLQVGWGVSVADIKAFAAYDVLKYSYLNTPATLIPRGWKEVVGGTQTYIRMLAQSLRTARVRVGTGAASIERAGDGYRVVAGQGEAERYDQVVLATNANQAAEVLARTEGAEEAHDVLTRFDYFDTTIALHSDTRLMPPKRQHWSTVNIRYDGEYSQFSVYRPRAGQDPVFKSWVTHDAELPRHLYATVRYSHPRVDPAYFALQRRLQALQGRDHIWLAGMYMEDVDCHESAVLSAVNVARHLAPASVRLKRLTAHPDAVRGG